MIYFAMANSQGFYKSVLRPVRLDIMYELKYDSARDEYTEVDFQEEFSDSNVKQEGNKKTPVLILKKPKLSKSRSASIKYLKPARIIDKSGRLNIFLTKRVGKNISYIKDLGNTLLTIQWRWILATLVLVNFACFFVFAGLLWVMDEVSREENSTAQCVVNAKSFTGYVLLSVETIMTIGYGSRYPTENCDGGWLILILILQALLNITIQGTLVSIVYVKISKPFTNRTLSLFSKTAVICLRDEKLRFIFRMHDFNHKIWCGTNISLYFVDKEEIGPNGGFDMVEMRIEPHGLLIFPLEIEHVIDEKSPLWSFRPMDILQSRFEIIAVAEGSSNITGQVSQNRTSYSNSDIFWGHRFKPCTEYDEAKGGYIIDYKRFKQTVPFETPLCSPKKLNDIQQRLRTRIM